MANDQYSDWSRRELDTLLAKYRPMLRLAAEHQIDRRLSPRCDGSDVVQEVLRRAVEGFDSFEGQSEPQLLAWLSKILDNVVVEFARRHLVSKKRSVRREERIYGADGSASFYLRGLSTSGTAPDESLIRGERALKIAAAIDSLNPEQFEVVQLRHIEGLGIDEIADLLAVSRSAVAGRLKRALKNLRAALADEDLV